MNFLNRMNRVVGYTLLAFFSTVATARTSDWPSPEDIPRFVAEMTEKHGFDGEILMSVFARLKPNPIVLKTIAPPTDPGVRSWKRYRARFLDTPRIENGVRFWNRHAETLARAEESFGVPPEIIVAIIGVETEYGKNKGNFSVLDALTTIAFAYPPRQEFFRAELEQFLLLARENKQAPEAIYGSYAGAIGIPQFMPGSQRRFAVDFDDDGRVDLMNSPQDAIGSVARFLKIHGWTKDNPIAEPVKGKIVNDRPLLDAGIKPSLDQLALNNAALSEQQLPQHLPAALVDLITPEEDTEFWWGFDNFYAITRYNRSSFYAMSVYQLSEAIKVRRADRRPLQSRLTKRTKAGYRATPRRGE